MMKVTSAARPSRFSSAKRRSMRVVICGNARWIDARQRALTARLHLGHADVDGAEHDQHEHADAIEPFLAGDRRARSRTAAP